MLRIPMIIFMALLIWLMPIDGARTYIVDDSGFANFNTIQEAVVAASNGDTVYIKPGEYNEEVILNKSLTLMPLTGESGAIILKGDGKETGNHNNRRGLLSARPNHTRLCRCRRYTFNPAETPLRITCSKTPILPYWCAARMRTPLPKIQ